MEPAQAFLELGARSPSMNASILNGADAALSETEQSPTHRCKRDLRPQRKPPRLGTFKYGSDERRIGPLGAITSGCNSEELLRPHGMRRRVIGARPKPLSIGANFIREPSFRAPDSIA